MNAVRAVPQPEAGTGALFLPEDFLLSDAPVLNGAVESGPSVEIANRQPHIENMYLALGYLGVASRGIAATTQPAAVQRIKSAKGSEAAAYLGNTSRKARRDMQAARAAFMTGMGADPDPMHTVAPSVLGAWVWFRRTHQETDGARDTRDTYRQDLRGYAKRFGYTLPKVA